MAVNEFSHRVPAVNVTDDREAHQKFWIAAYTRPRSEKKVAQELTAMGIDIYLPLQKQMRQWSDRKKWVEVTVIPMVIFIRIAKEELPQIVRHALILHPFMLPGSKKVAKIPDPQIEKLKFILGQTDYPAYFESKVFKIRDKVRVTRGALMGLTGEVFEVDANSSELIVSVGILGCAKIIISKSDLEIM